MSGRGFHQKEGGLDDLCSGPASSVDLTTARYDREALALHLNDSALKIILELRMAGDSGPGRSRRKSRKSLSLLETGVNSHLPGLHGTKINPKPRMKVPH